VAEYGTRYVLPGLATCVLPAPLLGLLFAALVSATMSSADSDLVAAGTLFANDIYKPYINPRASPDRMRKVLQVFTARRRFDIGGNVQNKYNSDHFNILILSEGRRDICSLPVEPLLVQGE
jgi:Na+/proline symporter